MRQHGPMTSGRRAGAMSLAAAAPAATIAVLAGSWTAAAAATCDVMTVRYAFTTGHVVTLAPPHESIPYGGCVQFTNNTAGTVTITVADGYSQNVGPGATTPPSAAYAGRHPGRHSVTARSGPTSASGTITVGAAPTHSASPTSSPHPTPSHRTSRPTNSPTKTGGRGSGPQVAPSVTSPPHHLRPGRLPRVHRPAVSPPVVSTPVPTPPPVSPSPAPAVVAGPIEPPSGRGSGLPAAVAALAVVGTGAAFVRVLLAEPRAVDSGRTVGSTT